MGVAPRQPTPATATVAVLADRLPTRDWTAVRSSESMLPAGLMHREHLRRESEPGRQRRVDLAELLAVAVGYSLLEFKA